MTKAEVLAYFGSVANVAKTLGITTQAVYEWGDSVPEPRQWQLQVLTDGVLKVSSKRSRQGKSSTQILKKNVKFGQKAKSDKTGDADKVTKGI
ncbi:probable transcriptional regulator, Cro-like [Hahella chejuensis KCTC 2396]|uniref:Probable transcriptional regulator, Cro-like n=1 Tax=Hahella chejuensis (strain KCTC 2396) TaxID=349521 RepID=Q2SEA2_HAHCH|nr:Cro/CI family transcriptional regulator [Hahella chejuensis]ABC31022.1 probable transcriptional regulator, Cro-like [Hahella chejuensis KCTC 2396]